MSVLCVCGLPVGELSFLSLYVDFLLHSACVSIPALPPPGRVSMVEPTVDPLAWRLEQERVAPRLTTAVSKQNGWTRPLRG